MDILPRRTWDTDAWDRYFARYRMPGGLTGARFLLAYRSRKGLRKLVVGHPGLLEKMARWHSDLVAWASTLDLEEYREAFGEGTAVGAENIDLRPHLFIHRACLLWEEALDSADSFLFKFLVDVRLLVLTDVVNWPFPGMTGQQRKTWLERNARAPNVSPSVTQDDISAGLKGVGSLGHLKTDLRLLAREARNRFTTDEKAWYDWPVLACGAAARAVWLAIPMAVNGAPFKLEDQPEIKKILETLWVVEDPVEERVVKTLEGAGDQPYVGSKRAYVEMQGILADLARPGRDTKTEPRYMLIAQGPGYGKTRLLRRHFPGQVILIIACWGIEMSLVPPPGPDALFCFLLRGIETLEELRRALLWMVWLVRRKLSRMARPPETAVSLSDLGLTEEVLVACFSQTKDPRVDASWWRSGPFLFVMFDEAGQARSEPLSHPEYGKLSFSEALRVILLESIGVAQHFGVLVADTSSSIVDLHPLLGQDQLVMRYQKLTGRWEACLPAPYVLHDHYDAYRDLFPLLSEISNWREFALSLHFVMSLLCRAKPLHGAIAGSVYKKHKFDFNPKESYRAGHGPERARSSEHDLENLEVNIKDVAREAWEDILYDLLFTLCGRNRVVAENLHNFLLARPIASLDMSEEKRRRLKRDICMWVIGTTCGGVCGRTPTTNAGLVSRMGAFLERIDYVDGSIKVSYQSDPVAAVLACSLLADPECSTAILEEYHHQVVADTLAAEGPIGEAMAGFLVVKAVVAAQLQEDSLPAGAEVLPGISRHARVCTVRSFFEQLGGKRGVQRLYDAVPANDRRRDILEGMVAFNHLIRLQERKVDPGKLAEQALACFAGLYGYPGMPGADILIPVIGGSGKTHWILFPVKNDKSYWYRRGSGNRAEPRKEVLDLLSGKAHPRYVFKLEKKSGQPNASPGESAENPEPEPEPEPYVTWVLSFGGKLRDGDPFPPLYFSVDNPNAVEVVAFGVGLTASELRGSSGTGTRTRTAPTAGPDPERLHGSLRHPGHGGRGDRRMVQDMVDLRRDYSTGDPHTQGYSMYLCLHADRNTELESDAGQRQAQRQPPDCPTRGIEEAERTPGRSTQGIGRAEQAPGRLTRRSENPGRTADCPSQNADTASPPTQTRKRRRVEIASHGGIPGPFG